MISGLNELLQHNKSAYTKKVWKLIVSPSYIIYWIYRIWFGLILWHFNPCRLFSVKSTLYTYSRYIYLERAAASIGLHVNAHKTEYMCYNQTGVDLGAMAMKGTPHSPKLQHTWNLTIRLFSVIYRTLVGGGSYPSAEVQSVYSTAPVLVVTKSLCGFVSNQLQYDMESAQYLG